MFGFCAYKMAAPSLVFNGKKIENNVLESYYIAKLSSYSSWKKEFLSVIVGEFHCQKMTTAYRLPSCT